MRSILNVSAKALGLALMVSAMSAMALAVPVPSPEIDPGSMAAAATLLSGGVLWMSGRRRAK